MIFIDRLCVLRNIVNESISDSANRRIMQGMFPYLLSCVSVYFDGKLLAQADPSFVLCGDLSFGLLISAVDAYSTGRRGWEYVSRLIMHARRRVMFAR
jgi:hypothetical protein